MLGRFNSFRAASGFSAKTLKPSAIILGDDDRFWVVNLATMERMIRAGYEIAG